MGIHQHSTEFHQTKEWADSYRYLSRGGRRRAWHRSRIRDSRDAYWPNETQDQRPCELQNIRI